MKQIILIIALALFSCGREKEDKVRFLLDWWPNPNHIPIFAGKGAGIFEKHGFSIDLIKIAEAPETIPFLLSKRADIALYYMPQAIRGFEKTDQIRVIGSLIEEPLNVFLFRKDKKIHGLKDLDQKVLGGSPDGFIEAYVNSCMDHASVKFSKVQKIRMDFLSALVSQNVDVVTGVYWNIEGEQLISMGIPIDFIPLKAFGIPNYEELIILSRIDFLQKDPTFATRFRVALGEAITFSVTHPEEAFAYYVEANPDKDALVLAWEKKAWEKTVPIYAKNQELNRQLWELFYAWMLENKLLSKEISLSTLLAERI